nr:retrovirus-related Pol polyprotein from transposon TNT 1-94 [Tanacetum cinerariifolium]
MREGWSFKTNALKASLCHVYQIDIMKLVISCKTAKATWIDLVHSFEDPLNTKENKIMGLKLEYQTFRVKPTERLSQTYTHYKTLLNELANDGVNLSKHEINDKKEVSNDEEITQVKVLMALADEELTVRKNHARSGEWIDITMRKLDIILSMDEDANWKNYLKYINIDLKHRYVVSSLMDMAYWLSEQYSSKYLRLSSRMELHQAQRENVDYPELIWKDFAFQIDHKKEKRSRLETMPFLIFTNVIINHFLSQHKSLFKPQLQHYHTIKDDGIISRLKFVRTGEVYQEYGLPIPDMMLNDKIKQSKSYQIKKTSSRRVIKKKVTISTDDNIIPDSDVTLDLGKSTSLAKAEEEEAARQVHATHARIVTEPVPGPARRRPLEVADTMKALKESKKTSKRQPGTRGSSEGTGRIPGVPDESTIVSTTSSEGTGTKPWVLDKEKVTLEVNVILEWGSKQESEYSKEDQRDDEEVDWIYFDEEDDKKDDADDDKSIDLEMTYDEETEDKFVYGDEQVNDDEDKEMSNAKVEDSGKGDAEIYDVSKTNVEKIEEMKDDAKKAELPPTSSNLSIFLENDVSELKKIDHSAKALAALKSQVPTVIDNYLRTKLDDSLYKIKKEQTEKQKMPKYTIKSTDKVALKEYDQKALSTRPSLIEDEISMDKGVADIVKNYKRQHDDDYDDDEDPSAGSNQGKKTKRRRTKESESVKKPSTTKETSKGKAPSKCSKTDKSTTTKELVEEPIAEVVMEDSVNSAAEDVVCDDDQPQDTSIPKIDKTLKHDWFKKPTPDPEWNKRQVNNPEGDRYPFDLTKPLPLKGHPSYLTVVAEHFFNNELEFLKSSDLAKNYTTSITKTKAARYEIVGIKDMVPTLWSHTKKILSVVSVKVERLHGYGHLDEIVVKRADRQLYKFKEVLRRVEDLQLGVESYQKKLNITAPHKTFPEIKLKELYTSSYKLPGVIYKDLNKQKRVMRDDELYKFSDEILKTVRDELHHRVLDYHLRYNTGMSRKNWTTIDK